MAKKIKNVLILSGSPRKGGNSNLLCDQFLKGAQEKGVLYGKGAYEKGDIKNLPVYQETYNMGRHI